MKKINRKNILYKVLLATTFISFSSLITLKPDIPILLYLIIVIYLLTLSLCIDRVLTNFFIIIWNIEEEKIKKKINIETQKSKRKE